MFSLGVVAAIGAIIALSFEMTRSAGVLLALAYVLIGRVT